MPGMDPNAQMPPQGGAPQGPAGGAPPEVGAAPPGQGVQQPQEAAGGEALLQPIQEMSDMIVQLAGPEMLAQVLEQGLQQIMQSQGPQQPQGPQIEPAAQPVPGGEGFGAMDR